MLDRMLKRVESVNSLYNIALVKLHEAINNFQYVDEYGESHNERRFIAMLKTYIKNAFIDIQYAASAGKRRPAEGKGFVTDFVVEQEETMIFEVPDNSPSSDEVLHASEIYKEINKKLSVDEQKIFSLLCQGYSAENIAGKLGIIISRVRHSIYDKIQIHARKFFPNH